MALTNLSLAEQVLTLSAAERAEFAKLLLDSLEEDPRTDAEIKADLTNRLEKLRSGADKGLSFQEVFGMPR